MHCSSTRHAKMKKGNTVAAKTEEPTARITRARAKALGMSGGIPPISKPTFKPDPKRAHKSNSKRTLPDENEILVPGTLGFQHKRRAALKDVTNLRENSQISSNNGAKAQTGKWAINGPPKKIAKVVTDVSMEIVQADEDVKTKLAEDLSKIRMVESLESSLPVKSKDGEPLEKEENKLCQKQSNSPSIVNIDSNETDSQVCSLYAPDIYNNIRVAELHQRPSVTYMETIQREISQNMRGILVDWLVEVSEEYKLVPDTLYLTVNLIDRFLSQNCVQKQRLQLLGVTCMLIASKYEEICAPRVEEFCFITDNTYTRAEVLTMERKVLNFLHFQLSVPTTKTFLRRFIQAAQACSKVPCLELELLANYLAELTLVEYDFLKFLPSLIAASAVFLARWTLNQSENPWNQTLEYYTNYKAADLKTPVLALEGLQFSNNGRSQNAIREKYRQDKFKCVANLTPTERIRSLFIR